MNPAEMPTDDPIEAINPPPETSLTPFSSEARQAVAALNKRCFQAQAMLRLLADRVISELEASDDVIGANEACGLELVVKEVSDHLEEAAAKVVGVVVGGS